MIAFLIEPAQLVYNKTAKAFNPTQVTLRKKRGGNSARPWSVSCISQLSGAHASLAATPTAGDVTAMSHNMSISESALNTLSSPQRVTPTNSNSKLRGSSTTVQVRSNMVKVRLYSKNIVKICSFKL